MGPMTFIRNVCRCSTPEGIGGGIRNRVVLGCASWWRCSTPEGIGGGIRKNLELDRLEQLGAQRPKASEGESGVITEDV
mgnify:CR=1 FL=1